MQTTIIFLSDMRLNTSVTGENHDLFSSHYDFLHNSTHSSRGVGILVSKKLNYTVNGTWKDNNNNILALRLSINDVEILLVSVYGPNINDLSFFSDLRKIFEENKDVFTVCGGDWNLTYSTEVSPHNIDILNMMSPPSLHRSLLLNELCENYNFSDPFRLLHYNTRDYTYIPSSGKRNRSRLDFFLVSDSLVPIVNRCFISHCTDTILFDHKSIKLEFGSSKKSNKHFINPSIYTHCRFEAVVYTTVTETYLHHAVPDQPGLDIAEGLHHVARAVELIRQANDLDFDIAFNGSSNLKDMQLGGINAEIDLTVQEFPDPELLDDITLSCDPDIFLETLMGNICNTLISFQAWIVKVSNCKTNALTRQLVALKQNYMENCDEIFGLESTLASIKDSALVDKIKEIKLFDNLHNEKLSPLFLNLVKNRSQDELTGIKSETGASFDTDAEREEHIVSFYEKLFKIPKERKSINYENCIENFLGDGILKNPIVSGSKLSVNERNSLETALSIQELDNSIKISNKKSAPGVDGFSNKLILKCWKFFRYPLLNYANHCFRTGKLTHNFRSTCIKLIPKKGNLADLKNWRPISLLSNMYKIISRAINERLKPIVNRICSRAQKGYNDKRFVQEVLINVCETISYCSQNEVRGCVLAVDMAKAFDTLDHGFIQEVYRFFGFGPNITRWLTLLGIDREECIILNNEKNSRYFRLETGRPQGDNLSPFTFNFCAQIGIFKLELDPGISRIIRSALNFIVNNHNQHESNRETVSA
jgi:exonuclease III